MEEDDGSGFLKINQRYFDLDTDSLIAIDFDADGGQLFTATNDGEDVDSLDKLFIRPVDPTVGTNVFDALIDEELAAMARINIPLAMPIGADVENNLAGFLTGGNDYINYIFEIGNNSGMADRQLHDDRWEFDFSGADGSLSYGGSYESNGGDAGIFSLKAINNRSDVQNHKNYGGRCVHRIPNSFYVEE